MLLVLISGGYLFWLHLSKFESTDDAQVDGQIYAISSRITGHVIDVKVEDEQEVKAGDVLVVLDPKDYEVAVAKARADLADAVATYQSNRSDVPITSTNTKSTLTTANSARLDASAGVSRHRSANWEPRAPASRPRRPTSAWPKPITPRPRRTSSATNSSSLRMKFRSSSTIRRSPRRMPPAPRSTRRKRHGERSARRTSPSPRKTSNRRKRAWSKPMRRSKPRSPGPQQVKVTEAKAQSAAAKVEEQRALLDQAELNLKYTTIVAPVDGVVGKKNVAIGQNVSAGQELMAVVPLDDLWITANFKETQLQ